MTSKRTIATLNENATLAKNVKWVQFARLEFGPDPGDVRRFHTEIGPRTVTHPVYGSEVYLGIGSFGGITGDIKESKDGAPIGMKLALTGIDSTLVNAAFTESFFRRAGDVMVGFEDENGDLVDDPEILFSGYMDKCDIVIQQNQANFILYLESRATNLLAASDLRFTDEELQAAYPGDLGGEYIYRMADLTLRWGVAGVGTGGAGGAGTRPGGGTIRIR